MSVEVRVPHLAESVTEATLAEWLKEDGAAVRLDEPIATLETDKAAVEIAASGEGRLQHAHAAGDKVHVGDVIARIDPDGAGGGSAKERGAAATGTARARGDAGRSSASGARAATAPERVPATAQRAPAAPRPPADGGRGAAPAPRLAPDRAPEPSGSPHGGPAGSGAPAQPRADVWGDEGGSVVLPPVVPVEPVAPLTPAVRRLIEEHGLDPAEIVPTGRGGRLLKEDVLRYLESRDAAPGAGPPGKAPPPSSSTLAALPDVAGAAAESAPRGPASAPRPAAAPARADGRATAPGERAVPMSRIRQRIAERLVQAQHTAAILTTFNEVDMSAILELRARWKEDFEKRHGVRLGFLSFFARACVLALEEIPELNAEIRGTDIVYKDAVHLGIAVGTERGLVVPVVRDAHRLGFAEIEREIARLAQRAREARLSLDELSGGTFTISNGGVYGSLLSTPILNPPQSGILGMHKVEKRPVAVNDQVVIRPMMYVALSYDHRIVDGEQAVTFLVRVKERLEDPGRMLLDV